MSTTHRARRSAQEWSTIVAAFKDSGLSEREFCEQQDLNLFSLRKWRYKRSASKSSVSSGNSKSGNFKPVVVGQSKQLAQTNAVRIHLGSEVQIDCESLSIDSIAQLALAVRHGR